MSRDYQNEELYITGESLNQPFKYFTYKNVEHLNINKIIEDFKKRNITITLNTISGSDNNTKIADYDFDNYLKFFLVTTFDNKSTEGKTNEEKVISINIIISNTK